MKKIFLSLNVLSAMVLRVYGQWEVHDVIQTAVHIENHAEQIAKMVETIRLLEKTRAMLGDASLIKDLAGLAGTLQTTQSMFQVTALPELAESFDAHGIFQAIGDRFTTIDGKTVERREDFRSEAALFDTLTNREVVRTEVRARRQYLREQMALTLHQLETAATHAETQKLLGVLIAQNTQLAATDRDLDFAVQEVVLQDIANRTDRDRQEKARREEQAKEFRATVAKLGEMLTPDTRPLDLNNHN